MNELKFWVDSLNLGCYICLMIQDQPNTYLIIKFLCDSNSFLILLLACSFQMFSSVKKFHSDIFSSAGLNCLIPQQILMFNSIAMEQLLCHIIFFQQAVVSLATLHPCFKQFQVAIEKTSIDRPILAYSFQCKQ